MADALNTTLSLNGAEYSGGNTGYNASIKEVRKYDKVLLDMLHAGEALGHTRHLMHKTMPMHLGTVLNQRRYFSLSANPNDLKLDTNAITGPDLKEIQGAAVEAKLEWYGNGIELNDVLHATHIDALMRIYLPELYRNARLVQDNVAAAAMYDGASKLPIKAYDATAARGSVTLGTTAAAAEAAGPLNIDVVNFGVKKMQTNVETYTTAAGTVKVPARIEALSGGRYVLQTDAMGMDDILADPKYKQDFNHGISAADLRAGKVTNLYRFTIEELTNFLTLDGGAVKYDWSGAQHVAFLLGKGYGFDVKMAGQGLKVYTKTDGKADSGDKYGRLNFITYKMAYTAKVANSMAIYAIVFTPGTQVAAGAPVAAGTPLPIA